MSGIKPRRGLLGLIVFVFCMLASTPIVWSGPIEEAVQLTKDYVKAFHEGNAEALSATFAKDGTYIPWSGPFPIVGRDAIRATMAGWFKAYPIRFIMLRDESRKVHGDSVIFYCNWTLIYGDGRNPNKTVYGRTSAVNGTEEGKRVLLLQATSLLPVTVP